MVVLSAAGSGDRRWGGDEVAQEMQAWHRGDGGRSRLARNVEDAANRPAPDGGLLGAPWALGGGVPHKRQGCGSLGFREEAAALQGRAREGM